VVAGKQVVWRIHKKLPTRQRHPDENKNCSNNSLVGRDIFSAFFVLDEIFIAQVALLLVAFGASLHLLRLPTFKK